MGKRKAKPVDELEALLQRYENVHSESEAARTACRKIRASWKSGDIATVGLQAFQLGWEVKPLPYIPLLLEEIHRDFRRRQAVRRQQTEAAGRRARARELAREVPGWQNKSVETLAVKAHPKMVDEGWRYAGKQISLRTVEGYLQGIHSPRG